MAPLICLALPVTSSFLIGFPFQIESNLCEMPGFNRDLNLPILRLFRWFAVLYWTNLARKLRIWTDLGAEDNVLCLAYEQVNSNLSC